MKSGLLLNVVVREGAAVFELLAGEDEALLVWGDALLVLDLGLYALRGVAGLHVQGDGLAREGLYKDLHAAAPEEGEKGGGAAAVMTLTGGQARDA